MTDLFIRTVQEFVAVGRLPVIAKLGSVSSVIPAPAQAIPPALPGLVRLPSAATYFSLKSLHHSQEQI